jgi:molybdenum cofactor cytidylyltransferase
MGLPPPRHYVAVILAGGESRRMGLPKALLDAGGETFFVRLCRVFREAGCDVIGVTGADDRAIRDAGPSQVRWVENRDWRSGQWSSVKVGLQAALDAGAERILLHPVDVPRLRAETAGALLSALGMAEAVVPVSSGSRGHPVALTGPAARRVLSLQDVPHLEAALERLGVRELVVDDAGTTQETDTPEEYQTLFGHLPRRA